MSRIKAQARDERNKQGWQSRTRRNFLRKVRQGKSETFYENLVLDMLGINKLKQVHLEPTE